MFTCEFQLFPYLKWVETKSHSYKARERGIKPFQAKPLYPALENESLLLGLFDSESGRWWSLALKWKMPWWVKRERNLPEDPPYWVYCSSMSSQRGRHPLSSGAGASRRWCWWHRTSHCGLPHSCQKRKQRLELVLFHSTVYSLCGWTDIASALGNCWWCWRPSCWHENKWRYTWASTLRVHLTGDGEHWIIHPFSSFTLLLDSVTWIRHYLYEVLLS